MEKKIGVTLATYRKAKKMSQIDVSDKLRNYRINVSNAAVSAWEKDISYPNAHQFLALCKILGITDIYNEFIGFNPYDPLEKLNEEGKAKALEYIGLLLLSEQFQKKEATINWTCGQKSGLERSSYVFEKTKRRSYKAIY